MKNTRISHLSTHRESWVEVNLGNLEHNVGEIRGLISPETKLLAVVKADAYGHGAAMIAPVMLASGVDMLGVASIDEGLHLRENNINCEILVLGAVPAWAFEKAAENNISVSIFSQEHLNACKEVFERTSRKVMAHIKVNTGMNRIGISANQAADFIQRVQAADFIDLKGIFTHLASAENEIETKKQFEKWENVISAVNTDGLMLHVLNSAGIIAYGCAACGADAVRAGLALYGLYPDLPKIPVNTVDLKTVMSLKARINHIQEVEAGEGISYSPGFRTQSIIKIATIPVGYADGVPRALSNKIFGELNGKKVRQIGNITMDQMMFDITGVEAQSGDVITLLSENLTIGAWAEISGTISYEIVCRLKTRLARVYTR